MVLYLGNPQRSLLLATNYVLATIIRSSREARINLHRLTRLRGQQFHMDVFGIPNSKRGNWNNNFEQAYSKEEERTSLMLGLKTLEEKPGRARCLTVLSALYEYVHMYVNILLYSTIIY
jgi:hypothetical protein